jgi:hypothetical protein
MLQTEHGIPLVCGDKESIQKQLELVTLRLPAPKVGFWARLFGGGRKGHVDLDKFTYKSIKPRFKYDPWFVTGKKIHPTQDEWTELVTTYIAATEKAREGKQIKDPYEVRYYWKSKKYKVLEEGDYAAEERVKYELQKIELKKKKPTSNYDEVVIMIDGVDIRRRLIRILKKLRDKGKVSKTIWTVP